jgi:hypothetical protein
MEHLIRICSEKDRQVLGWLRQRVGDAAITRAAGQCAGNGKPYLSAVCRQLGVRIPMLATPRAVEPSSVAEQSLAAIRGILASRQPLTGSRAGIARRGIAMK